MRFSDIIGQEVICESLKKAVETGKVSNAYIFYGAAGSGKKLAASVFATALNCERQTGEPCGICKSCIKNKSGNHPDVIMIRPSGQSIKIKQVWEVINDVSKKSVEEGYKIIIFDAAEKMTEEAQNAFLKTLEEPNEKTVFILITENLNQILPTIQSRCQVYQFRKLSEAVVFDFLIEKHKYEKEQAKLAALMADGSIGLALKILADPEFIEKRNHYFKITSGILQNSKAAISSLTDEMIETRNDAMSLIGFLISFYRDIMVFKELQFEGEKLLFNPDFITDIKNYSEALTNEDINCIMILLNNAKKQVDFNVNFKNSIDSMLFSIMEVKCNG